MNTVEQINALTQDKRNSFFLNKSNYGWYAKLELVREGSTITFEMHEAGFEDLINNIHSKYAELVNAIPRYSAPAIEHTATPPSDDIPF